MRSGTKAGRAGRALRLMLCGALALALVLGAGVPAASGAWTALLTTELASVATDGTIGDNDSWDPDISGEGRYVVFESEAENLAAGKTSGSRRGVFWRDRQTGTTVLVSKPHATATETDRGAQEASISRDGAYVSFYTGLEIIPSDTNNDQDLYIFDVQAGTYTRADIDGDGTSGVPGNANEYRHFDMSADGSYVVFETKAAITGDDTNGKKDIYRYDVMADSVTLVSKTPAGATETDRGAREPAMSGDGRYIAFWTGRDFVPEDDNGEWDLYIADMQDGSFHLADIWGTKSPDDDVYELGISDDGRYVCFEIWDYSLVPEDTNGRVDVYMYDAQTGDVHLVSDTPADATEADRGSRSPAMSADGRYVAFVTGRDFVPSDDNGNQDVYVADMLTGSFARMPVANGASVRDDVGNLDMSADGLWLAFDSDDAFVPEDTNGDDDVYLQQMSPILPEGDVRWAGATRYDTAVAVSGGTFPNGADTVVIATGDNWPDALCGSSLAGAVGAPILLTPAAALPQSVKDEIDRLGAENAYILGGTGVVSSAVEAELDGMLDGFVNRLAGPTRYVTSKVVADTVIKLAGGSNWRGPVLVTTGENFADALAGAPLGAGLDWPVLLANPTTGDVYMPAGMSRAVILGGTGAVPVSTEAMLKGSELANSDVIRIGGATRYETAAMTAEYGVENGLLWDGVGLATGENFPDGLTGGASAGLNRTVVLLTPTASLAPAASTKLTDNKDDIMTVQFFGGPGAVSPAVENQVKSILGM